MKAVQIVKTGPPESLKIVDIPAPEPGENELLIKVHVTGVNFADILCRQGLYPEAPPRPFVPGYEVAGTVEAKHDSVQGFKTSDRVIGLSNFGGYAEFAVCNANFVRPLNSSISFEEGAAVPVNWLTAYHCLYGTGLLEKDFKVLVHSAAGGVGIAALQLLKSAGCFIIGVAGTKEKKDFLKQFGVNLAINYRDEDFAGRVVKETGKRSLDIILDATGGKNFKKEWKLLRANGRIVSFGAASFSGKNKLAIFFKLTTQFKTNILRLMGNSHGVYGVNIRKIVEESPGLAGRSFDEVMKFIESHGIKPVIDSSYSLEKAGEAHKRLESGKSIGKIVLTNDQK